MELHPLKNAKLHLGSPKNEFCYKNLRWRNFSFFFDDAMFEGEILAGGGGAVNSEAYLTICNIDERLSSFLWVAEKSFPKFLLKDFEKALKNSEN